eukprot:6196083-Pleurochrysis_carterae.AAC.1
MQSAVASATSPSVGTGVSHEGGAVSDLAQLAHSGAVQLVLLCGPPCAGKSETCLRICFAPAKAAGDDCIGFERLSAEESGISLHVLRKRVGKRLQRGQKVVIDDQNRSAARRRNLCSPYNDGAQAVMLKPEVLRALTVYVAPMGGELQCEWANEWAMAEAVMAPSARSNASLPPGACAHAPYRPLAFTEDAARCAGFNEFSARSLSPQQGGAI